MLFNEKLYKLRKERNLSQEALAEKLGTTRQAISKWENGQGFPETEKLLQISNIFEVSVDYLLKDTQEETAFTEKGYYVSKEMAEGYLTNRKSCVKKVALGVAILILSITAFLKYDNEALTPVVVIAMILFGGFWALRGIALSDAQYKVLEKEPLIFDQKYLSELKQTSNRLTRNYTPVFVASFISMMLCVFALTVDIGLFEKDYLHGVPLAIEIAVAGLSLSVSILFYSGTILESYHLLAKNEEHVQGFWFRFWRKARRKTDELLK